jgi:flagellar biosynthetic protein FlhB
MAGDDSKTETATPRRLQKAREEGQVPLSREAVHFVTLAVSLILLHRIDWAAILRDLQGVLASATPGVALKAAFAAWWRSCALPLLGCAGAAAAGTVLQTGLALRQSALVPDLTRLSPLPGLRRMLGGDGLLELLRTLFKLALALGAAWSIWPTLRQSLLPATGTAPAGIAALMLSGLWRIGVAALMAQAVIAGADILVIRRRFARGMRMSREDIKREHKDMEGDPRVRARLRQIRMIRARNLRARVAKATVVVTNPTHYAIALQYDGHGRAPVVVAKGADHLAGRIRALAAESGIPLYANAPLARALHTLPLDSEIPAEHYQAVAEIIAYVWRLARQARL